jgi:hypothetical protein
LQKKILKYLVFYFDQKKIFRIFVQELINMKTLFTIPNDLTSIKDDVLDTIEKISTQDFVFTSGLVFVKLTEVGNDYTSIGRELQEGKQSWGILSELIASMQMELKKLLQEFEGFYHTKSNYTEYCKDGLSPMEINYLINALTVRIKRMQCVLNPAYNKIDFQDKKTPNRYTMIKGYWIADDGSKKRSFSKSISNTEASLEDLIAKIIKSQVKDAVVIQQDKSMGYFRPDLIVSDGKDRWAVEIKLQAKDSLIRTFVMLEMWKLYKQTYELIS